MDALGEIEALVGFDGRTPGSDAERRAANHLRDRLLELGREAEIEPVDCWPNWPVAYAIHAVIAIVGSVLSVSAPVAGAALALLAVVLTFLDATGMLLTTRRLLGRRASQNVVSPEDRGKEGTLLLVAHYDAGRTGAAFGRRLQERRAVLGRVGPLQPLFWAMVAVLVCTLLRLPGLEGVVLTAIQFVPTVALIFAVPPLLDVALAPPAPGANDNASGVAAALRLAERCGGRLEGFDLWVVLTGAQEALGAGMRSFLKRHRLDRTRTVVINLDEVGRGMVRVTSREGLVLPVASHPQLVGLGDADPLVNRTASDGYAASSARIPAITVTCRNAIGYVPDHHQPTDTPDRIDPDALQRAEDFCAELIERVDAELSE